MSKIKTKTRVLVVDDEEIIRTGCERILTSLELNVDIAENGQIALEKLSPDAYDLILLDLYMPELDGMKLLDEIQKIDSDIVTIIMTGYATIENAVETIKKGAYDYLPKPFSVDEFRTKVDRGLEKRKLILEARQLREERDRNLLEISKEKSRTLTILNCMSEGLIATNRFGQIVLMNQAATKMIRLTEPDIIGKTIDGLLSNPELEQHIKETLEKVTKSSQLTRLEFKTKDERILQSHIMPIIDEKNQCLGTVTVLSDITEEKKLEKSKSDFVRLVAHELKAPFGAIQGYLNLILEGYVKDDPEREREMIARSRDKAAQLIELVNDLLALSRTDHIEARKIFTKISIAKIISESVENFKDEANAKSISLQATFPDNLPEIRGHQEELLRLVGNLLNNAIKYTPEKGSICINLEKISHFLVITVKDSGIGIAKKDHKKIFEEFYRAENIVTRKIPGTGLGLSIAKKIAERHHGYIEVESEPGQGSTFRVFLPIGGF